MKKVVLLAFAFMAASVYFGISFQAKDTKGILITLAVIFLIVLLVLLDGYEYAKHHKAFSRSPKIR